MNRILKQCQLPGGPANQTGLVKAHGYGAFFWNDLVSAPLAIGEGLDFIDK